MFSLSAPLPVFSLSGPLPRAGFVNPAARLPPCALDRADDAAALLSSWAAAGREEPNRPAAGALPPPLEPIDPSGDLLRAGTGVESGPGAGAGALDAAAAAATLSSRGDLKAGRDTAAAVLPLLAVAAETVCTGEDPSGFIAAAPLSYEILRRAPPSGRGRGGEEIAPPAPANRMGGRSFPAFDELVDEGVREPVARSGDGAEGDATFFPKGVGGAAAAGGGEARLAAGFLAAVDAVLGLVREAAGVVPMALAGETKSRTIGESGEEVGAAVMVGGVLVGALGTASTLAAEGDEMSTMVGTAAARVPAEVAAGVLSGVQAAVSLPSSLTPTLAAAGGGGVSLRAAPSVCDDAAAAGGALGTTGAVARTGFSLGPSEWTAPSSAEAPADTRISGDNKLKQVSNFAPGVPIRLLRLFDPSPNDDISDTGVRAGGLSPLALRASRPAPSGGVDVPDEAADVDGDAGVPRLGSVAWSWAARWSRWRRRSLFSASVSWRTSACFAYQTPTYGGDRRRELSVGTKISPLFRGKLGRGDTHTRELIRRDGEKLGKRKNGLEREKKRRYTYLPCKYNNLTSFWSDAVHCAVKWAMRSSRIATDLVVMVFFA